MKAFRLKSIIVCALLSIFAVAPAVLADWDEGDSYKMHYPQLPMIDGGWDVCLCCQWLADDFVCSETGPITDIHFWVSFKEDMEFPLDDPTIWDITIRDDAGGIPGAIRWTFSGGTIVTRFYGQGPQGWLCPSPPALAIPPYPPGPDHHGVYQVNITDLLEPMIQERGTTYWLVMRANVAWQPPPAVGWKQATSFHQYPAQYDYGLGWMPIFMATPETEEIYDLAFVITGGYEEDELDFSDAPEFDGSGVATLYPTTLANNGARHVADGVNFLGLLEDIEPDGQPTLPADGDDINPAVADDEDGVIFVNGFLTAGNAEPVDVFVSPAGGNGGYLNVWIDYNADFDWDDPCEWVLVDLPVSGGLNNLTINVPTTAVAGPTYARFRYTTYQNSPQGYSGQATDGEVEDYLVDIEAEEETDEFLKFQQLPLDGVKLGPDVQNPSYWGHDEVSTAYMVYDDAVGPLDFEGCYMADDFADYEDSPVIKLRWWGSYLEEKIDTEHVQQFLIAFEKDIPAVGQPGGVDYIPSHPGDVLYSEIVNLNSAALPLNPGEFTETFFSSGGPPCNEALWEYEALLMNPFPQDPNTVYWLKIVALYDIGTDIQELLDAIGLAGYDLCEFLHLTYSEQMGIYDFLALTRWGWHNRDYTIMDPYASKASDLAVGPGEHVTTFNDPISGSDVDVWHFQDDAVSGDVIINPFLVWNDDYPESPYVFQEDIYPDKWHEEYYKYFLPYCVPATQGVDGPEGIEQFSKDLAFELYTKDECFWNTHADYTEWQNAGKPKCWCNAYHCYGDSNGAEEGSVRGGYYWVSYTDLTLLAANWQTASGETAAAGDYPTSANGICADIERNEEGSVRGGYYRVSYSDLTTLAANWQSTTTDTAASGDDPYTHNCGGELFGVTLP